MAARPERSDDNGGGGADRLTRQVAFLLEADRLKQIERQTAIVGGSRRENTAEHSWHLGRRRPAGVSRARRRRRRRSGRSGRR